MKKTPFSKKNVIYARFEAYVFSIVLLALVFFDKDVSGIASVLLGLAWTGYKSIQLFYIKMAEREHLEEIRHGRTLASLETGDIDMAIDNLEATTVADELGNEFY